MKKRTRTASTVDIVVLSWIFLQTGCKLEVVIVDLRFKAVYCNHSLLLPTVLVYRHVTTNLWLYCQSKFAPSSVNNSILSRCSNKFEINMDSNFLFFVFIKIKDMK